MVSALSLSVWRDAVPCVNRIKSCQQSDDDPEALHGETMVIPSGAGHKGLKERANCRRDTNEGARVDLRLAHQLRTIPRHSVPCRFCTSGTFERYSIVWCNLAVV